MALTILPNLHHVLRLYPYRPNQRSNSEENESNNVRVIQRGWVTFTLAFGRVGQNSIGIDT
ncbi:hypothetical protein EWM60_05945 [Candidatus Erwinia dacicola]|nr:hypothetical protein [Candidatus Erwinia dacicola]